VTEPKTFDAAEVLARRDESALEEIEALNREREAMAAKLREAEERERQRFANEPDAMAKRELARRALCRKHYLPFVMRFNPDYLPGWVHKDICLRLERFSRAVAMRQSPRLMLTMPPRHGKSTLTSKTFAAWHLGHYPNHEFMSCSYSGSLSMSFSRMVRTLLRDRAYQSLFDTRLDPESQSAEAWLTSEGGGFTSAGIGGAITGKGAHILNIDDPVKNREDAESETARQNAKDWYTSTAYTRLAPGGGVLIILTRWHDDDLAGWLINNMKKDKLADQWELVNYPAIALEDEKYRLEGEALHPERYDLSALLRIKKNVGERDFSALYQQQPQPDEGGYFKSDNFVYYDWNEDGPDESEIVNYVAWDLAIGQNQQNDYSVGICVSIDRNDDLWIREVVRGKWDSMELVNRILNFHRRWKPDRTGVEKGMIEMTLKPYLDKEKARRKQWDFIYTELKTGRQDKVARARAIQGMHEARKIHIPHNAPWTDMFVSELSRFPTGTNDDQVDAFAWIGQMIALMNPQPLIVDRKPSWRDKLAHLSPAHRSAMSA
jgi:predicted phage terminase large subunit-like protein